VLLLPALLANAAPYVLAVGVNDPGGSLQPLRYADDDAVAAATFFSPSGAHSWLLTLPDADTARAAPEVLEKARPPTRQQLRQAVAEMANRLGQDKQAGLEPVVVIWLVGHGAWDEAGGAYFALADDKLSPEGLLEDVLRPLSVAHRVHLIVDACHAGAFVRSRAVVEHAAAIDIERVWRAHSPSSFLNVGVVSAAGAQDRTWEWDEIGGGVFSALVRAGLSGAADADGDDAVTYPELSAWLAAAVQAVPLKAARPRVSVEAPAVEPAATLARASWLSQRRLLSGDLSALGVVHIEDGAGHFLLGGRFEPGFVVRFWLPERPLRLLHGQSEHILIIEDDRFAIGAEQTSVATTPRGRVEDALRDGLFQTAYGPAYFAGYRGAAAAAEPTSPEAGGPPWLAMGLLSGAGAAAVAASAGLLVGVQGNLEYNAGDCYERACAEIYQRAVAGYVVAGAAGTLMLALAGTGSLSLWLVGDDPQQQW
jgi:hypothetical protein